MATRAIGLARVVVFVGACTAALACDQRAALDEEHDGSLPGSGEPASDAGLRIGHLPALCQQAAALTASGNCEPAVLKRLIEGSATHCAVMLAVPACRSRVEPWLRCTSSIPLQCVQSQTSASLRGAFERCDSSKGPAAACIDRCNARYVCEVSGWLDCRCSAGSEKDQACCVAGVHDCTDQPVCQTLCGTC